MYSAGPINSQAGYRLHFPQSLQMIVPGPKGKYALCSLPHFDHSGSPQLDYCADSMMQTSQWKHRSVNKSTNNDNYLILDDEQKSALKVIN